MQHVSVTLHALRSGVVEAGAPESAAESAGGKNTLSPEAEHFGECRTFSEKFDHCGNEEESNHCACTPGLSYVGLPWGNEVGEWADGTTTNDSGDENEAAE